MELKNDASRLVVVEGKKDSGREDDPICSRLERKEKLPHVRHPAWMQVFPAQRRTSSVEETTTTLWKRMIYGQCSSRSMQLRFFFLSIARGKSVSFPALISLSFSPHLSTTSQPVVPCIFLSCPVEISLASPSFLELLETLSLSLSRLALER